MKPELHIISHTHWDREWYMSFESHRARLVELMDCLIETMERNPDYKYFHLDGQTIVIEDYLEIKPEMKSRLDALIKDGRIQVGPWYVLQDETLISGEANIRNMLEGHRFCKENGYPVTKVGYFPDAFANISQAPQILSGFGIDNAVFGRGLGAVMADNKVGEVADDKELIWEGADKTRVLGIMFTEWYDNANEMPVDENKCKEKMDKMLALFRKYSKTSHWLGMNGSDHQPIQQNLVEALDIARQLYGEEVEIVHSNFNEYISALRPEREKFTLIKGELTGQKTTGKSPISDTASTHQQLKIKNHSVQNLLEQQSEPISVMAMLLGDTYRDSFLRYGWKKLMQNHPHDSICACSCDDVAIQMSARFDCARDVAEYVRNEAAEYIAENIDTKNLGTKNLVVFHTNPGTTFATVKGEVWLKEPTDFYITDKVGKVINADIVCHGKQFTFKLPKDSFRVPIRDYKYTVTFPAKLSGVGYSVYKVNTGSAKSDGYDIKVSDKGAENKYIKLQIENDGTLNIYHKITEKNYTGFNLFEDSGDSGDGYNYKPTADAESIFSKNACVRLLKQTPFSATFEITSYIDIPKAMDENKCRSTDTVSTKIVSTVTLTADSRRVDIKTTFNNQCENHRLRAYFPTEIKTPYAMADGQFDVIRREIKPGENWQNPCYNQRMQAFVGIEDEKSGVLIASRGIYSYEILRDSKNTVALTLLRAVGTFGDWTWGQMSNPLMQVKGEITLEYSVIPYEVKEKASAFNEAYTFSGDRVFTFETGCHDGKLPQSKSFIKLEGDFITATAFKRAEESDGAILRICNVSEESQKVKIDFNKELFTQISETNLAEDETKDAENTLASKIIKTYRIK